VKIVRQRSLLDLRSVPIDELDMYLLSRLDEPMSFDQLVEMCPCDALQAVQRITRLAELGLLELCPENAARSPSMRAREPGAAGRSEESTPTLRPVPLAPTKLRTAQHGVALQNAGGLDDHPVSDEAVTLRPPSPAAKFAGFGEEPATGVRRRVSAFASRPRLGSG
jgi:hypothetical protein